MSAFEDWLDQEFKEKGIHLEEANLFSKIGEDYWHSTVITHEGLAISGGFHSEKMQARKVALSEYLERKTFHQISQSKDDRLSWGINIIPTACGFAAGFDKFNTVFRALGEACERWVMSMWIDEGYYIEEIESTSIVHDAVSQFFVNQFDTVRYFKKNVKILFQGQLVEVAVAQTLGLTKTGIFPGMSAQVNGGSIWQHALLESYRHLLGAKNNAIGGDRFPWNRVRFFANNKEVALEQISRATKTDWPLPETILEKAEGYFGGEAYLARIILRGWRSWEDGPIERFLY